MLSGDIRDTKSLIQISTNSLINFSQKGNISAAILIFCLSFPDKISITYEKWLGI